MTGNRFRTALAVLIFVSLPIASGWAQSKVSDVDSDAVNEVIAGYVDAFNHHDAHALAMFLAENGDMTNAAGETSHGRQQVMEHFMPRFAEGGALKTARRTFTVKSVDFLKPDLALAFVDSEMSGLKTPDGSDAPPRKMLYDITLMKQDGHWLIANFHETNAAAPAPPAR